MVAVVWFTFMVGWGGWASDLKRWLFKFTLGCNVHFYDYKRYQTCFFKVSNIISLLRKYCQGVLSSLHKYAFG